VSTLDVGFWLLYGTHPHGHHRGGCVRGDVMVVVLTRSGLSCLPFVFVRLFD
jgi:hypothetical protein